MLQNKASNVISGNMDIKQFFFVIQQSVEHPKLKDQTREFQTSTRKDKRSLLCERGKCICAGRSELFMGPDRDAFKALKTSCSHELQLC